MNTYRYLIAFTYNNGTQWGRVDIATPAPIRSQADLHVVENDLRQANGEPDTLIMSFSLYADPRHGAVTR